MARVRELCGTGARSLNVRARLMNVSASTLLSLNCLNLTNSSWFRFVCTKKFEGFRSMYVAVCICIKLEFDSLVSS